MKHKIEPHIVEYIDKTVDVAIEKSVKSATSEFRNEIKKYKNETQEMIKGFNEDAKRHAAALREGFRGDLQVVVDMVASMPSRKEIRSMIHEEITPLVSESKLFREEMRALRRDSNDYEKRIAKLEHKAA